MKNISYECSKCGMRSSSMVECSRCKPTPQPASAALEALERVEFRLDDMNTLSEKDEIEQDKLDVQTIGQALAQCDGAALQGDKSCMTQWNEPIGKHYMVFGSREAIERVSTFRHDSLEILPAARKRLVLASKQCGVPEGYVLVPKEPDMKTILRMVDTYEECKTDAPMCEVYKAMIAAAPVVKGEV